MARTPLLLTVLALTGLTLQAEEPQQPNVKPAAKSAPRLEGLRWGVQVGIATPTTDTFKYFSDKGTGFVIGAQATWDWTVDMRWRARVDYTAFPKATVNSLAGHSVREDNSITGITAGLDHLYFWSGKPEGFYTTVGVALTNWKQGTNTTGDTTKTSLGLAAGMGAQFNKAFGLELRATWARWDTNIVPTTIHNAGTLNLEGSYRF